MTLAVLGFSARETTRTVLPYLLAALSFIALVLAFGLCAVAVVGGIILATNSLEESKKQAKGSADKEELVITKGKSTISLKLRATGGIFLAVVGVAAAVGMFYIYS